MVTNYVWDFFADVETDHLTRCRGVSKHNAMLLVYTCIDNAAISPKMW